jgi:hypothetical protein
MTVSYGRTISDSQNTYLVGKSDVVRDTMPTELALKRRDSILAGHIRIVDYATYGIYSSRKERDWVIRELILQGSLMDSIMVNIDLWDPMAGGDRPQSPINFPFLYSFGRTDQEFGRRLTNWLLNEDFLTRCKILDHLSDNSKHMVHYYLDGRSREEVLETIQENRPDLALQEERMHCLENTLGELYSMDHENYRWKYPSVHQMILDRSKKRKEKE